MIGFTGISSQLQPIIKTHDQWLSKTRSIPYWTTNVFSPIVTNLVLIYEEVTSASAVRSLTLHSGTLLRMTNAERRLTCKWTRGETNRDHYSYSLLTTRVLLRAYPLQRECVLIS
jgi:hypothetical protein